MPIILTLLLPSRQPHSRDLKTQHCRSRCDLFLVFLSSHPLITKIPISHLPILPQSQKEEKMPKCPNCKANNIITPEDELDQRCEFCNRTISFFARLNPPATANNPATVNNPSDSEQPDARPLAYDWDASFRKRGWWEIRLDSTKRGERSGVKGT